MWDTWMLKENGRYHLFTLTVGEDVDYWDRVCHHEGCRGLSG